MKWVGHQASLPRAEGSSPRTATQDGARRHRQTREGAAAQARGDSEEEEERRERRDRSRLRGAEWWRQSQREEQSMSGLDAQRWLR